MYTAPDFGYSDAMLEAATDGGSVVSVDEAPLVTERAHRAHRAQAYGYRPRQISFRTGPLRAGWPDDAPYDLVVSLCPIGWLPNARLRQCRPGAAIVQVLSLEIPNRLAFVHVDVDDHHRPVLPRVLWRINGDLRNSRYAYSMDAKLTPATDEDGYDIAVARHS